MLSISYRIKSPRPRWRRLAPLFVISASLAFQGNRATAEDPAIVYLDQSAKEIHAGTLVLDSHVDIPLDYGAGSKDPGIDGDTQVDLPKLERGGVGAAVFAVFAQPGWRTSEGTAKARREADTKLKAILDRAEAKDYRDISAMLSAGVSLEKGVGSIAGNYRRDPALPLKALGFFKDGDLPSLPKPIRICCEPPGTVSPMYPMCIC